MPPESTSDSLNLASYSLLSNVDVGIMAELDHRKITFRELLVLDVGNVLVLKRPVGENIEVYVDRVLLGTGEILVLDENLAVRLADLRDRPASNQHADKMIDENKAA